MSKSNKTLKRSINIDKLKSKKTLKRSINNSKILKNTVNSDNLVNQITVNDLKKSKKKIDSVFYNIYTIERPPPQDDLIDYKEMGMITMVDAQGLNILRRNITKIKTFFGSKGLNTYIYNYGINNILKKVNDEMKKQYIDKIVNAKIKMIIPQYLEQIVIPVQKIAEKMLIGDNDVFMGGRAIGNRINNIIYSDNPYDNYKYNDIDDKLELDLDLDLDLDYSSEKFKIVINLTRLRQVMFFFTGTALQKNI
jgi:hypothetical protein